MKTRGQQGMGRGSLARSAVCVVIIMMAIRHEITAAPVDKLWKARDVVFRPNLKQQEMKVFHIYFGLTAAPKPDYPSRLKHSAQRNDAYVLANTLIRISVNANMITSFRVKGMKTDNLVNAHIAANTFPYRYKENGETRRGSLCVGSSSFSILQEGPIAAVLAIETNMNPSNLRFIRLYHLFDEVDYFLIKDFFIPGKPDKATFLNQDLHFRSQARLGDNTGANLFAFEQSDHKVLSDVQATELIEEKRYRVGSWISQYNRETNEYFGIVFKHRMFRHVGIWFEEEKLLRIDFTEDIGRPKETWITAGLGDFKNVKRLAMQVNEYMPYIGAGIETKGSAEDWWDNNEKDDYGWEYRMKVRIRNTTDFDRLNEPCFLSLETLKIDLANALPGTFRVVDHEAEPDEVKEVGGNDLPSQVLFPW